MKEKKKVNVIFLIARVKLSKGGKGRCSSRAVPHPRQKVSVLKNNPRVNNFNKGGFKVLSANVDGITTKMIDLDQCIEDQKPDIIALTEVKPKNSKIELKDSDLVIEGYHLPVNNLDQKGRGICIYVSQLYGVEDLKLDIVKDFKESVWVNVKIGNNKKVVLGCVYRSPSSDSENNRELETLLRAMSDESFEHMIIVGDFNYPNVDWDTCTATDREGSDSDQFMECLNDCFLVQHVDQPTRFRGSQRPSILDLILTNEENVIRDMQFLAPLGNSDHCTIVFHYICQQELSKSKTKKYKYDKGNYSAMRDHISSVDWENKLMDSNTP